MSRELDDVALLEAENLLEPSADRLEDLLALSGRAGAGLVAGKALADGSRPQTDTVEALTHVHHNTHHLAVSVVLQGLADGGQLGVEPQLVDGDGALVLERVRPFAAVLVLGVFPLGPDSLLEEVIVGLEAQFRGWRDVVLVWSADLRKMTGWRSHT